MIALDISLVLTDLELAHFRNLGVQALSFPAGGVAIVGDNAQGKSNLVEAIYYLESLRSFRGASDSELGSFHEEVFHVRGSVGGDRSATVAVGFDRRQKKKKVTLDGNDVPRFADALGKVGAVVFSPADAGLVTGGPGRRRRFLDVLLSLNRDGYIGALQEYRRALAQRNAALRAGGSRAAVRVWDGLLVRHGAAVTRMRHEWVSEWAEPFAQTCAAISGEGSAAMTYLPSVAAPADDANPTADPASAEALQDVFRRRLDDGWENDARRGSTGRGPHRDELRFTIASGGRTVPARSYGSGGQRRTLALALRLTEAATIRQLRAAEPVLLLDDAFAELDPRRSERVIAVMERERSGQVILTVPKESDIRLRGTSLAQWRIRNGVIEA